MIQRVITALVLVAAAGCGTGQPPADSPNGGPSADAPAGAASTDTAAGGADTDAASGNTAGGAASSGSVPSSCDDLHYEILKAPPTRQAFADAFGPPDSVAASVEPNRHIQGATDSLFTVHYPGAVLEIRTPPDARDMATHVRVTDSRYLAFPGIGPGTPADRVEEVLGEPHERSAGYVRYQCSEAVEQPVTFRISDGRVIAVEIDYYVD